MEDVFGPGGALARALPGYEPRARAGRARRLRSSRRSRPASISSPRRAPGVGKSLAYLRPGARVRAARRRRDGDEGAPGAAALARTSRSPRPRSGATSDVERAEGPRELPLPPRSCRASSRSCSPTGATPRAWEAMQDVARLDRDRRPRRARARAVRGALGRARGRARPVLRPPLPVRLARASPRRRASGPRHADLVIVNHALYFAHLASGGGVLPEHDAVDLRRGAPARGVRPPSWLGGRVSRAGLRRLAADVERACREAQRPFPALPARPCRADQRRGRAGRRGRRPGGSGSVRYRPRRPSCWIDALGDLAGRAARSKRRPRRALAACPWRRLKTVEACLRPREGRAPSSGESRTRSRGAPSRGTCRRKQRERLWCDEGPDRDPRLGHAHKPVTVDAGFVRRRRLRLDDAREAVVGSPFDFPTQALLYVPRAMPDPRGEGFTERAAEEIVFAASPVGRGARSCSRRATGRSPRTATRCARPRAVRGARARRGAAGTAARALPRRGGLGAPRNLHVLAGRRRARRVALAARDRQAAVLGARRPAARGALRGGRARSRRRLVPRLRAADGRCSSCGKASAV